MKRTTGKEMPAENNNTALASMNVKFSREKIDIIKCDSVFSAVVAGGRFISHHRFL